MDAVERGTEHRPRWRILRLLRASLVAYLIVVLVMMWLETLLIFPTWQIPEGDWRPDGFDYEDVFFESNDGTRLHGWYFHRSDSVEAVVLYCHGNGEDVARLGEYMDELCSRHRIAVFAFDYRGYGKSEGRPDEPGIIDDSRAARNWLAARNAIAHDQVILWGRSIGGAVAVQLAAESGARAVILERTFTSLPDVAARHYPWLPVRWLMRNRFDSLSRIDRYAGPLLQSHGTADEVVPLSQGRALFDAATAAVPKRFVAMEGVTHNGPNSEEYYTELEHFFENLR